MTTTAVDLEQLARRFPLVPRPRPTLPPLPQQLAEIADLARTPTDHPDADTRIATAHNKAALTASNCGQPDLARTLCWQHHHSYTDRQPWTAREARLALEPLINLARLHIRAGHPDTAVTTLESLLTAAGHGDTAHVDGHPIDLGPTIATRDDRDTIRPWLWTVTLADGLRALARAGRWDDALAHAERHHGIGATLLDGRQIAVLAHTLQGDHTTAAALLANTVHADAWQDSLATILRSMVRSESGALPDASDLPGSHPPVASTRPVTDLFVVEVRLAELDLLKHQANPDLFDDLINTIANTADAGIARAVLTHPARRHIPCPLLDRLREIEHLAIPAVTAAWLANKLAAVLD